MLRRLAWRDRALLVEACLWLAAARAALLVVPFRRLAPHLGEAMTETSANGPPPGSGAARIGWAVRAASRATPWKTPCLAEAMAGQRMLRRRHLPSTIYVGVARDGEVMAAHAWLRCGGATLTGQSQRGRFTPLASFAQTRDDVRARHDDSGRPLQS
jgi:hypothetical protein